MKLIHLIISATLALLSCVSTAQSEELMGFDRASYSHDTVVLSQPQSGGTRLQLEAAVGSYNNELIRTYGSDSAFARIGKSVGRLDVVTDNGVFPCTAFIVSKKYILTNYHCSTGILARVGATRIDIAYFVAGYTMTGIDAGTKKYSVIPTPIEFDEDLDYAVLEVLGDPSQDYGELKLANLVPQDGTPFWIIGHPHGEAQRISREKCRAGAPAISRDTLLHTCDTLPGNSGSPVIDVGLRQVVALHRAGISNDDVNQAILMSKILENSTVLAAYKAPEDVPKSQPVEPKTAAHSACDALYSAAAEAKACYAYNAYVNSCSSHSLAPIAKGYINEFCKPQETVKVDKAPEKTCAHDPSLCSSDQLCGQSLTFASGKADWRTDNASYVIEAKRRGLSCGVNDVVAKPKKTCSEDVEICDDSQLCAAVAIHEHAEGIYYWAGAEKQIAEAKRRSLSCGGILAEVECQGSYNQTWRNCFGQRNFSNGNKYFGKFKDASFNGRGTYTFANGDKYVGNFKNNYRSGQGIFTYLDGTKYVGEFRSQRKFQHGFNFDLGEKITFCEHDNDKPFNCVGKNAYDVAVTLKNQFSALLSSQRKTVQTNLKRKGLYTSSIDGNWGRGTLMALVEFSSMNLGTVDLRSAAASKKLLDAVLR